jgi:hypothetical protein
VSVLEQLSLTDLRAIDQGGSTWNLIREACAESHYFFNKSIFTTRPANRNLITASCHLPLSLFIQHQLLIPGSRTLIEDPRGFMKSTMVTKGGPNWLLVRRVVRGEDPSLRNALYSSTMTNSQRFWRETKGEYEGNEWFQFLIPELIPDFRNAKVWNESEGIVPRAYNPKEPTFDCLGGGKATSRHYDIMFVDDMINEENCDSPTAIEKAIEYYLLTEKLLESEAEGIIVAVGNRWTMRDLNHHIHKNEPATAIFSRSCWGPNIEGEFKSRGLPEVVKELLARFPNGEPLWPERFDRESLGRQLAKLGPRLFSAQLLNNPADPDAVDFKMEWVKYCEMWVDANGLPWVLFDGDPEPVSFLNLNLYLTWDPAIESKSGRSRNAMLITGIDPKGRIVVLKEYAKKEDPRVTVENFLDLTNTYKGYLKAVGVEEVMFATVLKGLLIDKAKLRSLYLPIRKLKVPQKTKDQRIRAWAGTLFADGRVYVRKGLVKFLEEYGLFGVPDATNDLMDCFAYATQLFTRPMATKEREQLDRVRKRNEMDRGITGYGSALA